MLLQKVPDQQRELHCQIKFRKQCSKRTMVDYHKNASLKCNEDAQVQIWRTYINQAQWSTKWECWIISRTQLIFLGFRHALFVYFSVIIFWAGKPRNIVEILISAFDASCEQFVRKSSEWVSLLWAMIASFNNLVPAQLVSNSDTFCKWCNKSGW